MNYTFSFITGAEAPGQRYSEEMRHLSARDKSRDTQSLSDSMLGQSMEGLMICNIVGLLTFSYIVPASTVFQAYFPRPSIFRNHC